MSLLPCPKWETDEPSKLPDIAQAASGVYDFFARQNPKKYVLTHGDLKDWHRMLFAKVVPVPYFAGNYRGKHKDRHCLDTPIFVNGVSGSPPENVEDEMRKFSEQMGSSIKSTDEYFAKTDHQVNRLKAVVQLAAFIGGSIIRIHPFINGNGRIARMAMNFIFHRYYGQTPFYIDRPNHPDYSSASAIAMKQGNYTPLYQYLLEIWALRTR